MGYNKTIKKFIILFLLIFFQQSMAFTNIIYDKDDILITELDLKEFQNIYFENKRIEINKLKAIKEIVLLRKTIAQLEKKQPDALKNLDKIILNEFGENVFNSSVNRDFLRLFKIRNDFIIQYFNDELKKDDIKFILNSFSELNIPLSKNNCKIITNYINAKNNNVFIEKLFENFKNNQSNYEIEIENEKFNFCINEKVFSIIEKKLIDYIEIKTENRFKAFIYEK